MNAEAAIVDRLQFVPAIIGRAKPQVPFVEEFFIVVHRFLINEQVSERNDFFHRTVFVFLKAFGFSCAAGATI
jgi:hypothetical protein